MKRPVSKRIQRDTQFDCVLMVVFYRGLYLPSSGGYDVEV